MIILGIETSCDETALAIYDSARGLLGHVVHSQLTQLSKYGGIIPEVAARYHVQYLTPLLHTVMTQSGITLNQLNYIAYTKGPGLIGSLLTGITFAKTLSLALNIPAIGINHLEGHLLACFIQEWPHHPNEAICTATPTFPFLALLASGGHTILIQANSLGNYTVLGETIDDAAGEALDKTAKLLGLDPPNGKSLAQLACNYNDPTRFYFPRPLNHSQNLNFSFSGLKTAALTKINQLTAAELTWKADLACAFEAAVMDTLASKCYHALIKTKLTQLVIAGGVSANLKLRENLYNLSTPSKNESLSASSYARSAQLLQSNGKITTFFPKLEFCTDNAAMIAIAGLMRAQRGEKDPDWTLEGLAKWDLSTLN